MKMQRKCVFKKNKKKYESTIIPKAIMEKNKRERKKREMNKYDWLVFDPKTLFGMTGPRITADSSYLKKIVHHYDMVCVFGCSKDFPLAQ
jgi:hypothetical protein